MEIKVDLHYTWACAKTKGTEGRIMHKNLEQIATGLCRQFHLSLSKKIFLSHITTINYLQM